MCGLVGIAGDLHFADEFIMKRLLLADYFRGPDSTGLAAIRTNGEAHVAKLSSNPIDLFGMTKFNSALNGNQSRAFIGHNRAATRGAVNSLNAHPFHFKHIVGAHNGTLDKESVKALEDKLGMEYPVDSMALFASIAEFGIDKTIKMCYEGKTSQDGAWALVWFDQNEGTINFLRNKHRPLYFAYIDAMKETELGFKRLVWASEWWMIREALASSTPVPPIWTEENSNVGFFPFEEDLHYKFDLATLCTGSAKVPKPKVKKIKGKEVPVTSVVPFVNPNSVFPKRDTTGSSSTTLGTRTGNVMNPKSRHTSGQRPGSTTKSPTSIKVIHLKGTRTNPYAGIIDEGKFVAYPQRCQFCEAPITYGQLGVSFYERDCIQLCPTCVSETSNPLTRIYVRENVLSQIQANR